MEVEGWTTGDPAAPVDVETQWEIPDMDALPDDAAWNNPYHWDIDSQTWEEAEESAFDTHQEFLDWKATQ